MKLPLPGTTLTPRAPVLLIVTNTMEFAVTCVVQTTVSKPLPSKVAEPAEAVKGAKAVPRPEPTGLVKNFWALHVVVAVTLVPAETVVPADTLVPAVILCVVSMVPFVKMPLPNGSVSLR